MQVSGPGKCRVIRIPGSKSYTNRALAIASLAEGTCRLTNALRCEDTDCLIDSLKLFGVKIKGEGTTLEVTGRGGRFSTPLSPLDLGGSGSGIRFAAGLASLCEGKVVLTGNRRLLQRPMAPLLSGLEQLGVLSNSDKGYPPLEIMGGTLKGGRCCITGDISSQFVSSLLLIAPYAKKDVTIEIVGSLASGPYIEITLDVMRYFGVEVERDKAYRISNKQRYVARDYHTEPDASSASYFFAAAAITGNTIAVEGIGMDSKQGDIRFVDILKDMGCRVQKSGGRLEVSGRGILKGVDVDMSDMPDMVPTLAVVAAFAKGTTCMSNISNIRLKESDRLVALQTELQKVGIHTESDGKSLSVIGGYPKGPANFRTYEDHRIAMSLSLFSLMVSGINIENPGCVNKSFPGFWEKMREIDA